MNNAGKAKQARQLRRETVIFTDVTERAPAEFPIQTGSFKMENMPTFPQWRIPSREIESFFAL
ncbi:MAG: hypothetical protein CR217_18125 [Beijerinckiaceae bacterium]|nr:MAG: hypothetical protein CR217_18125 [Beijerinckiaceae bacterium]